MKIRLYEKRDKTGVINLIGNFRIRTAKLKGIEKSIDLKSAEKELEFYPKKKLSYIRC